VRGRAPTRRVQSASCRLGLAAAVVASVSGCGLAHLQDLNFRVDDRLHFVSPDARTTVQQPLSVSWAMSDFTVAAPGSAPASRDAGFFGVFVDRAPIHPGETLKAVGHGDPVCDRDAKCPDKAYLNSHYVFTTTATHLQLPRIPDLRGVKEKLQLHSITVVLLDTDGRRIGESAWQLDVRIPKAGVT
jgi:hypothetical protein